MQALFPPDSPGFPGTPVAAQANWQDTDVSSTVAEADAVLRQSAISTSRALLDRDGLLDVIREERDRRVKCSALPASMLFFAAYTAAALGQEDVKNMHRVAAPLYDALAPRDEDGNPGGMHEVETISDLWGFLNATYLPLFFGYGVAPEGNQTLQWPQFGQVQGPVMLLQQRSIVTHCGDELAAHTWCYPAAELSKKTFGAAWTDASRETYRSGPDPVVQCDDEGFSVAGCDAPRRLALLREELAWMKLDRPWAPEYGFEFTLGGQNVSQDTVQKRLEYLQERGWLDEQSVMLHIQVLVASNVLMRERLENVVLTFIFSRGGSIFSTLRVQGMVLRARDGLPLAILNGAFLLALLLFSAWVIWGSVQSCREDGNLNARWQHCTFANLTAWLSFAFGWINVLFFFLVASLRGSVIAAVDAYSESPTDSNAKRLTSMAEDLGRSSEHFSYLIAFTHMVFMCRIFVSLRWQSRLATVTRTFAETGVDLMHFLIVLMPTFFAFAIAGGVMFGRRLQEYATLPSALGATFKIAMECEFNWRELSEENLLTSMVWIMLYVVLVVLLLLNMVLAIIMEVYQEVRQSAGAGFTIPRDIHYLAEYIWNRKQWIDEDELCQVIELMPPTVSTQRIEAEFPLMTSCQRTFLFDCYFNKATADSRRKVDMNLTARMVAGIQLKAADILQCVRRMSDRSWLEEQIGVDTRTERTMVKAVLTQLAAQKHGLSLAAARVKVMRKDIYRQLSAPAQEPGRE